MPDEREAAAGTTEGAPVEQDADKDDEGAREQGTRTEDSEDLSSPQFTVPAEPREDDGRD